MTVQASDGGVPPRSQEVTVTVKIKIDKNMPEFKPADYAAEMTEDQSVGSTVITVSASDKDVSVTIGSVYVLPTHRERGWGGGRYRGSVGGNEKEEGEEMGRERRDIGADGGGR